MLTSSWLLQQSYWQQHGSHNLRQGYQTPPSVLGVICPGSSTKSFLICLCQDATTANRFNVRMTDDQRSGMFQKPVNTDNFRVRNENNMSAPVFIDLNHRLCFDHFFFQAHPTGEVFTDRDESISTKHWYQRIPQILRQKLCICDYLVSEYKGHSQIYG